MPNSANERKAGVRGDDEPARKRYQRPAVRAYGSVRDLTLTVGEGQFNDGGGDNIYAS